MANLMKPGTRHRRYLLAPIAWNLMRAKAMNWKTGLFRVWLLMSIVWFAFAGIIASALWQSDQTGQPENFTSIDCAANPDAGPWCKYQGQAVIDDGLFAVTSRNGIKYDIRIPTGVTSQQAASFVQDNQDAMRPADATSPPAPTLWKFTIEAATIIFGLPMLIMVFGLGMFWAFGGFGVVRERS
jgi:hypothetical protein